MSSAAYRAANREQIAASDAARYAANRARRVASSAAYRAANKGRIAVSDAAYRAANKDRRAAYMVAWHAANKERVAVSSAAYRAANKERVAAYLVAWHDRNPERRSGYTHDRRSKLTAGMTKADRAKSARWRRVHRADPCHYCGGTSGAMSDDHVYPLSKGGTDHWWNLVRACQGCNSRKKSKLLSEWLSSGEGMPNLGV